MDRLDHLTTESEKRTTESDRRVKILEYVKERQTANQKTTKATVIRYLKEKKLSSRETTLNLINELIREGKLNKEEINSQVHFLTINETNAFNAINAGLTAFEAGVNAMFMSLDELYKKSYKVTGIVDDFSIIDKPELIELKKNFNETIQSIIITIANKIHSEEDAQILYTRISKILQKGPPGFWSPEMTEAAKPLQSLSQRVANFNKQVQMRLEKEDKSPGKPKPKPK